jgi:hypothetical protein
LSAAGAPAMLSVYVSIVTVGLANGIIALLWSAPDSV